MSRVAIVGGGISGLSAAYYLGRHGIPCTLIEREQRLGGIVRTERFGDCLVEAGPDSWLAEKAWMLDLVRELGLGDQVMGSNDDRRRTYIVRRGRARPLPESMRLLAPSKPWQAATSGLFGLASKARMASEWFRRPRTLPERSVAEFVEDHFGREAVEYLAQPLLAGVYGSTVLYWLNDESEGREATWEFLDRRIGDVMQIPKLQARVRTAACCALPGRTASHTGRGRCS